MDARALPQQKTLFELSYPLFLHSVLMLAVVLIDTMIISAHSPGAAAAVNVANQVLLVAYEFSMLLGVGGVILISHSLGRGDEARAREIAAVTIIANTVLGLLIGVALAALGPCLLRLLNTPEAIAAEARLYIRLVACVMIFNGFMVASVACLRGFGRSRTVLVMGVFAASFYLAAEYVLILGLRPVPALGVLGSALGTLVTRLLAAAILVVVLVRTIGVPLRARQLSGAGAMVRRLFALSIPSVSENIAYSLYQLVLLSFAAGFGVAAVLSRAYVMIAGTFLTLTIMAISQGNEVLLGWQRGAGHIETVHAQALRSAALAVLASTTLALLLYLGSDTFIGLFTQEPAVLALSRELLFLTVLYKPAYAVHAILAHSLKAVGDVRWPVVVSLAVTWGFSLPLAWLFCVHLEYGVAGIWYALIAEEMVKATLMYIRWQGRGWLAYAVA
jgi:putative MATE family efflux protein